MNISEKEFRYYEQVAEVFKTLGHSLRLSIIGLLIEKERLSVTEIFNILNIEQAVASHHLRIMRSAGIVAYKKSGKHSYYYIADPRISNIYNMIKFES